MKKIKLNIVHSTPLWLPQTQTWMYNQICRLCNNSIENHIVCERTINLDQFHAPNIHCLAESSYLRFLWEKCMRKCHVRNHLCFLVDIIKKYNIQIVHSHFGNTGWFDLGAVSQTGVKHVVSFYGHDVKLLPTQQPEWKKRYQELFEKADLFLCEGPYMAKCIANLGCSEKKLKIQRLGIELDNIPFISRTIQKDNNVNILIAGTFREKKGIPDALEAIAIAKEKYPRIRVTVVGDSTGLVHEEIEKKKILQVIKQFKLEPIIRMTGFQSKDSLKKEAYKHHIFISPSVTSSDGDTEGGAPVTIIEMAASGMPVISTLHCDIPFVLGKMNAMHLVHERDPKALADKILEMINMIQRNDTRLIRNNRYFIEKHLNISNCVKHLSQKYFSLF